MMCIGGVLLCPIAPLCCGWLFQRRSRHAAYMQNDSIFTPKRYDRCARAHAPPPSFSPAASRRLPLTLRTCTQNYHTVAEPVGGQRGHG